MPALHGSEAPPYDPVRPLTLSRCCQAATETVRGSLRPLRPTDRELAAIADAARPVLAAPATSVRIRALPQIPRHVPTWSVAEGFREPRRVRIGLRTFLIDHPKARILLDPSIGSQVRERVLGAMPTPLRQVVTPPADILSTVEALHRADIMPESIDLALSTHLHWDHVSGLLDLPHLPLRVHRTEWDWITDAGPAPVAGVRPALIGRDVTTFDLDGPPVLTFPGSHDLFGDGSVLLVDLVGHTPGSVGVLAHTDRGWVLIAGDAAWHHLQVDHAAQKAGFPGVLVDEDRAATYRTLLRLHAVREQILVVPTHDHDLAAIFETRNPADARSDY